MAESFPAAAASPRIVLANPAGNAKSIIDIMSHAGKAGAKLLVLPELCVTGATCGDLFWQQALLEGAERALMDIAAASREFPDLTVAVGAPLRFEGALYSCAAFLRGGEFLGAAPLASGDPRIFASPQRVQGQISLAGRKPVPFAHNLIIRCGSVAVSAEPGAEVLACLSAFPADAVSDERLPYMAARASAHTGGAFIIACPGYGESYADRVYTGLCAIAENGCLLCSGEGEDLLVSAELTPGERPKTIPPAPPKLPLQSNPFLPDDGSRARQCNRILELQAIGLARYMESKHASCVTTCAYGGADAALALLVCSRSLDKLGLPRKNLKAVIFPAAGDAQPADSALALLANHLGAEAITADLGGEIAYWDIKKQARARAKAFLDFAGQNGGAAVFSDNLTELALGSGAGAPGRPGYCVNAGVPATVVRAVLYRYAEACGDSRLSGLLLEILEAGAPLGRAEADKGGAPEDAALPLYDFFLYHFVRDGLSPAQLLRLACKAFEGEWERGAVSECLKSFLRLFFSAQSVRSLMPEGPAVLGLSLSAGTGWRMPPDAKPELWLSDLP